MPVSVHYRLCLVTVRMKVLHNVRLVRFSNRTGCWCAFSCSVCDQTATSLGVSRAAVPKVMTTYTDHGKTSSAESSCGRTPKLSERDRRTLQRIVSKTDHRTAAAKVTTELSIHLRILFVHKQSDQSFTNPTATIKGEKDGVTIKPGCLVIGNVTWSGGLLFTFYPASGQTPKEA